ncbi:MAG TPA: M13-type metalloendopeptidase [Chakrabartia sp.]|nr:M13-type metalloendopeptidase [Chakrabartia sp.]
MALASLGATAAVDAAPKASKSAAAKPQFGSFGVDLSGMDTKTAPGDDFYRFVNGAWADRTLIPDDRSSWGGFMILRDLSDQRTRAIIEDVSKKKNKPGSAAQKVGDYFASFMDEAAIEKLGITPLRPALDAIAAIRTPADLAKALGQANREMIDTPVGIGVEQDLKDNSIYSVYVGQGGLGLPDRDYYLVEGNPRFAEARTKYKAHIATMLGLAGYGDAQARAQRIYDLEVEIAKVHWSQAELRQVDKLYNPMTLAELGEKMPGLDWTTFVGAAGLADQSRVIVTQPSALIGTAKLLNAVPLDTWKDYLALRTVKDAAPLLSKAFVDENFAFEGKVLTGTPALKERWKRGVDGVNSALGEAVGQIYVARYFPPAAKAKADALVKNLITAMDGRLAQLEWMSADTKVKARAKLKAFTPKIGYPDKWRDYSKLMVKRGDAFGNAVRATEFEYERQLAKIGKPVDRGEWFMTPQTVNAYANPLMNEIVFPAAILQPPFFDPNADPAVNYGGIGAVIGHEISHHFDDQGRKFDMNGNLADWWSADDVKRFEALTAQLVKQYSAYEPLPGVKVNGELTLGENIADLAGLTVAYDAYRISLNGKPAPLLDGYTGDQRFFMGYGQVWRNKYRDALLQQLLTTDEHTPGHVRPMVVRNLDAWYAAFEPKDGQKMVLAPNERVRIW